MLGAVKLTRNADPDKYKCSGYGIGFDLRSKFSLRDDSMGKNVTFFGVDMSSYVHTDNKKKNILIPGNGTTQGLDIIAELNVQLIFQDQIENFV